jgi:type II secretory pathway predicted ATPase ExeA
VREEGRPSIPTMPTSSSPPTFDQARLVVSARHRLLAEIVHSLMQGTQFVALTGPPGIGRSDMATAIQEELARREVRVQRVDRGGGSSIRLSTIIAQLLGKLEGDADLEGDDIEWLFDAMTEREPPDERQAVVIDDAELLHSDVIRYLRLLSSVAMERMPQIVFVGDPSFWDVADRPPDSFKDLITARWELDPLTPDETCAATEQLHSRDAASSVADDGAPQPERTAAATEQVAGSADAAPEPDAAAVAIATSRASVPAVYSPRRIAKIGRLAGAATVVGAVAAAFAFGTAVFWWRPLGADKMWQHTLASVEHRGTVDTASHDQKVYVRLEPSKLVPEVWPGASVSVDPPAAGPPGQADAAPAANVGPSDASQVPGVSARARGPNASSVKTAQQGRTPRVYEPLRSYEQTPDVHGNRSNPGTWLFVPNLTGN